MCSSSPKLMMLTMRTPATRLTVSPLINLLDPVGVATYIQVQVEVEAVPSSKDQLLSALDALGIDDDSNMDDSYLDDN